MTHTLDVLQSFYGEKLAMLVRHEAVARLVVQYDANNTYQYVINREETQLSWLASAIIELGGSVNDTPPSSRPLTGKGAAAVAQAIDDDATDAASFVERWRPRVDAMDNARHARMLRLILGETLEQQRFFEQAKAGRTNLLGRRGAQLGPSHGEVLPSRWVE